VDKETNLLRTNGKRFAVPLAAAAVVMFSGALIFGRSHVNAAVAPENTIPPITNSSIDPLLALDQATEAVASHVTPAVVNIAVTSRGHEEAAEAQGEDQGPSEGDNPFSQFFGPGGPGSGRQFGHGMPGMGHGQRPIEHGIGSGVIISPDGYIITNNHVVDGAMQVRVTLHDRRTFPAKVIGIDKLTDLAVVKIDAKDLPTIAWGDSTKLVPGQSVLAIGNPFGYFRFSITRGIVSAVGRPNLSDDARKPGNFIQTDAAINPGNSGGPLVNAHGELIGINTFLISSTGTFSGAGFAIPTQTVHPVVESLIKNGVVHHGYLGVGLNDVTPDNAQFFNLTGNSGALITSVAPNSPASRAGLKEGDVVTGVDGRSVETGSDLQVIVSEDAPGSKIQLEVMRNGHPEKVDLTVGEYHKDTEVAAAAAKDETGHARLGIAISDLTPDVRQQLNLGSDVQGVAVAQVTPGSPAEDAGLTGGDVILELNRKPVTSAEQFRNQVKALPAGKDMLITVWANGGTSFRVVHPETASGSNGM
jgi:serine protease Do